MGIKSICWSITDPACYIEIPHRMPAQSFRKPARVNNSLYITCPAFAPRRMENWLTCVNNWFIKLFLCLCMDPSFHLPFLCLFVNAGGNVKSDCVWWFTKWLLQRDKLHHNLWVKWLLFTRVTPMTHTHSCHSYMTLIHSDPRWGWIKEGVLGGQDPSPFLGGPSNLMKRGERHTHARECAVFQKLTFSRIPTFKNPVSAPAHLLLWVRPPALVIPISPTYYCDSCDSHPPLCDIYAAIHPPPLFDGIDGGMAPSPHLYIPSTNANVYSVAASFTLSEPPFLSHWVPLSSQTQLHSSVGRRTIHYLLCHLSGRPSLLL